MIRYFLLLKLIIFLTLYIYFSNISFDPYIISTLECIGSNRDIQKIRQILILLDRFISNIILFIFFLMIKELIFLQSSFWFNHLVLRFFINRYTLSSSLSWDSFIFSYLFIFFFFTINILCFLRSFYRYFLNLIAIYSTILVCRDSFSTVNR